MLDGAFVQSLVQALMTAVPLAMAATPVKAMPAMPPPSLPGFRLTSSHRELPASPIAPFGRRPAADRRRRRPSPEPADDDPADADEGFVSPGGSAGGS